MTEVEIKDIVSVYEKRLRQLLEVGHGEITTKIFEKRATFINTLFSEKL